MKPRQVEQWDCENEKPGQVILYHGCCHVSIDAGKQGVRLAAIDCPQYSTLAERDSEIERLQGIVGLQQHELDLRGGEMMGHMNDEVSIAIADRDWWRRVGKMIGATLYGFTYRNAASFIDPSVELPGSVAILLLEQQAEIERLQELLTTGGLTNWVRKYTDAKAEIERLQAIEAKLPKTADGVPVVPGMVLWPHVDNWLPPLNPDDKEPQEQGAAAGLMLLDVATGDRIDVGDDPFGNCYSTREAAEAAGEKR